LPTGLFLRITNVDNSVVERTFTRFPVRIGRSALNDLNILDRFVSQFHAVVELHEGQLMLRDLGSSNGTKVGGVRAPAHEPIAIASSGNHFSLGPLEIDASIKEVSEEEEPPKSELPRHDILEDSIVTTLHATVAFDNQAVAEARAKLAAAMQAAGSPATSGSNRPPGLSGTLMMSDSNVVRKMAGASPNAVDSREAKQRKLEQIALQGVREISRALLPHAPPLEEPEDLVRFLSKTRDTIEVFLRSFVPLREGYRQFASQMHIQTGDKGTVAARIEAARDERELAQHLLDWTNRGADAHKAIEGTFADLMIHQLALLHAIMRGVKSLLDALSPRGVEAAFTESAKQGKTSTGWGPWRFKALWRFYGAKHGDMDDGDKRIFAALFGPDFAESYKQYRSTVDSPPTS
jgi:type VI secretion system protein ImpI